MFLYRIAEGRPWSRTYGGLAVVIASVAVASAAGQCVLDTSQKLTAEDPWQYDMFGKSVAISGNVAVVGVPFDDDHYEDSGSVYVYRWDGAQWGEPAKLYADSYAEDDAFGYSVDVDGDYIIVGAPGREQTSGFNGDGAAFVFHYDGQAWSEAVELPWPCSAETSFFGGSVSIDAGGPEEGDEVAIVGAYQEQLPAPWDFAGAAHVYEYHDPSESWIPGAKLIHDDPDDPNDDPEDADRFGYSVSIEGDVAVVGVPSDEDEDGSVYVFRKTGGGWEEDVTPLAKIIGPVPVFASPER